MNKKHMGSTLDSLFEEMVVLPEMNERLSKRIFVEQLHQAMKRRRGEDPQPGQLRKHDHPGA